MIDIQNVEKYYGSTRALCGIRCQVSAGKIVGLLGPNGAGKSTLMRIVTTYLASSSGTVSVAGFDVATDPLEVRKRIGYLPEETPLYREMRTENYLRFIGQARQMNPIRLKERLTYVIDKCGLQTVARKPISNLSKGYRQRVGLAQALIHSPDILILDEPSSGLDPNQIVEIRELIREVGKEKTVILSTHILQEVTAVCSEAIIINRGHLVAQGPLETLTGAASQGSQYLATIRGDSESVLEAFRAQSELNEITLAESLGESARYRIQTPNTEDIGELVFETVRDAGLSLSELVRERDDIESLFQRLTTNS